MATADTCFHCALPIPRGCLLTVAIGDAAQPVCCPGCKAVSELIRDTGLQNYYRLREAPLPGSTRPAEQVAEWQNFNRGDMQRAFSVGSDDRREATIYAGGMYCAACSWLIESSLSKLAGVLSVVINPITHRLRIEWTTSALGLGDILATLAQLGYRPQPLASDDAAQPEVDEQRAVMKRLIVASLGMMQVMMFAVGLYAGDFQGIDDDMRYFLRLVSFFVATPVVFYAAKPFFTGAWRGVVARRPGMDLPVSLAIGAAYAASVYATFTRGPAVWFDSVAMFVFFLTLGRYLEMRARHRSVERGIALSQVLPNTTTRVDADQRVVVPVSQLRSGDIVMIRAGDAVPADGVVLNGSATLDEALLTGEATPQRRSTGDDLVAGSVNLDGTLEMCVERTGSDTSISAISRLSERARFTRPQFVQLADRIASYVVVALLLVATAVAVFWTIAAPERAFVITLSVLVVTCPCALALATPAAFAAAGSRMSQLQLLVTNGNAIDALSSVTRFMFDKTGTLTKGRPVIQAVTVFDRNYSEDDCRTIAAALQRDSSHPLASAFQRRQSVPDVTEMTVHLSAGVSGVIAGQRWRIGNAAFACCDDSGHAQQHTVVYLACNEHCVARFDLADELRPDAVETLSALRNLGIGISLVSGDGRGAVEAVARKLRIDDYHAECSAEDKLAIIKSRQSAGERVVMIGDGINDAPVLAGADTSIAPGHAALLAQTSADIIMLGDSLRPLMTALRMARQTMRIVRQNLSWAIVYNALALPLAAAGLVPPWLAAIGMSVSSLVVVMNALRLGRYS